MPESGPLRDEVNRIRDASTEPALRAEAALALVQNRIRYVALMMGEGGLVPADAATTWSRRFGDCKAKTALLLAMLAELGIDAAPVAVSVSLGDGLDQRLPTISAFDHVLVRATIDGRTYWLDGTRTGDTRLSDLLAPPALSWGLPLTDANAALVPLQPSALDRPSMRSEVNIDASGGVLAPAPIHVDFIIAGDGAIISHANMSAQSADGRERLMREYWRGLYDDLDIDAVSMNFDAAARELRYTMDGRIRMRWRGNYYEPPGARVGYDADFRRDPGPDREAPFALAHPFYHETRTAITLPPGAGFSVAEGALVDTTLAGVSYRRVARLEGNVLQLEQQQRSVASEFPATEAAAAQSALRALANKIVYLVSPSDYEPTRGDLDAEAGQTPTDAAGLIRRGNVFLEGNRLDAAIADFTRALELDPGNALALANRGIAYVWEGKTDEALRDLDAAEASGPNNIVVLRARGLLAVRDRDAPSAITHLSRAIAIQSDDSFSLGLRAEAYAANNEPDAALADAAAALRLKPHWPQLYLLRSNLLRRRLDIEGAAAEATALAQIAGDDPFAHVTAARIFAGVGRHSEAIASFDRALAIRPEAYIYLNRAMSRPLSDREGRMSDIDQALALAPGWSEALMGKASVLEETRDYARAVAAITEALASSPGDVEMLARRGAVYARMGEARRAENDFRTARAAADTAQLLNNLCWAKATAGVALENALSECDEAVRLAPDSAGIIDSRAFVLLRLNRLDEAIAAYDRALSLTPNMSASLFGRGLARERSGDVDGAQEDFAAAARVDPDGAERFASFGLIRQGSAAP